MPGVNGTSGPMWSQLLNMEPPDSPSNNSEAELMLGKEDSGMESLDYEVVESLAYREDQVQSIEAYESILPCSASSMVFNTSIYLFHIALRNRSGGCNGQFDRSLFEATNRIMYVDLCVERETH